MYDIAETRCPYKVNSCDCQNDEIDCRNAGLKRLPGNLDLDDGLTKL